jgi:hypothetical protein
LYLSKTVNIGADGLLANGWMGQTIDSLFTSTGIEAANLTGTGKTIASMYFSHINNANIYNNDTTARTLYNAAVLGFVDTDAKLNTKGAGAGGGAITFNDIAFYGSIDSRVIWTATGGGTFWNVPWTIGFQAIVSNLPTVTSGNVAPYCAGMLLSVTGNTQGSSTALGIWIDNVSGADVNRGIVLDQDNTGGDIVFGEDQRSSIYSDKTNFCVNTALVGTGKIKIAAPSSFSGGAGSAALGANCPATTLTSPNTWWAVILPNFTTGYIPVWN